MIVCLCEAVNDATLRSAIEDGATSVRALCKRTKAGSQCGMCVCDLKQMIKTSRASDSHAKAPDLMAK